MVSLSSILSLCVSLWGDVSPSVSDDSLPQSSHQGWPGPGVHPSRECSPLKGRSGMPQKHAQLRVQPPWVSLNSHSCMTRLCLSPSAPLKAWSVWTFSSFLIPCSSEVSSVGPELGGVVPLLVVRVSLRLVFNWLVIVVGFGSLWGVLSPVWGARCPFSLPLSWDMCT